MALRATMIFLAAAGIMAASLWLPASGQSACTTALIGLAPCLSYISGNSSSPSSTCCSQLGMVVQSQPQCLCTVLNGGASSFGISINQTQALALPGACKVQTPPVSQCKGGAAASPSGSPAAPSGTTAPSNPATPSATPSSPGNTPGTSVAPSGSGSKSTNGDSSDGRRNKSAMAVIFSALILASCISTLF